MSTSAGQKVTPTNPPEHPEPTGPVAPDSLAAESIKSGGAFAGINEGNNNSNNNNNKNDKSADGASFSNIISATTSANLNSTQPHTQPAEVAAAATENKGVDKAPTYVNASAGVRGSEGEGQGKPGGKGLVEDPELIGRPAKFEAEGDVKTGSRGGAQVAGGGAVGGGEGETGGKFDVLGSKEA